MSQLILDTTDPAINEMVSQWEDGGTYRVELIITQQPGAGALKPYTVDEVIDYGDAESAQAEEIPDETEEMGPGGNRAQIDKVPIPSPD